MNDYAAAYGAASALARIAIDEGRESIGDERADYMLQLLEESNPTPTDVFQVPSESVERLRTAMGEWSEVKMFLAAVDGQR